MAYHADDGDVYHTDADCPIGSKIKDSHWRGGKGGQEKCEECDRRREESRPGIGVGLSLRITKGSGPSIAVEPKLVQKKRRQPRTGKPSPGAKTKTASATGGGSGR